MFGRSMFRRRLYSVLSRRRRTRTPYLDTQTTDSFFWKNLTESRQRTESEQKIRRKTRQGTINTKRGIIMSQSNLTLNSISESRGENISPEYQEVNVRLNWLANKKDQRLPAGSTGPVGPKKRSPSSRLDSDWLVPGGVNNGTSTVIVTIPRKYIDTIQKLSSKY